MRRVDSCPPCSELLEAKTAAALEAKGEAERQAYRAGLLLAQQQMEEGHLSNARVALDEVPDGLRNFEWEFLRSSTTPGHRYQTLLNNGSSVLFAAWSDDASHLVVGTTDHVVRILNATTFEEVDRAQAGLLDSDSYCVGRDDLFAVIDRASQTLLLFSPDDDSSRDTKWSHRSIEISHEVPARQPVAVTSDSVAFYFIEYPNNERLVV